MRGLALDTWAFVELALDGPRRAAVEEAYSEAHDLVTVHFVVAESFNFIARRGGGPQRAWLWLQSLRRSPVRVLEPRLADVEEFAAESDPRGLSLTDCALAWAAVRDHVKDVATEDREFRRLGLHPLFARR